MGELVLRRAGVRFMSFHLLSRSKNLAAFALQLLLKHYFSGLKRVRNCSLSSLKEPVRLFVTHNRGALDCLIHFGCAENSLGRIAMSCRTAATAFGLMILFATIPVVGRAQLLPVTRNSLNGYDAYIYIGGEAYADPADDSDSIYDGDEDYKYMDLPLSAVSGSLSATNRQTAEAQVTTSSSPSIFSRIWIAAETSSGIAAAVCDTWIRTVGEWTVQENPNYPGAGVDTDSATLSGTIYFNTTALLDGTIYNYDAQGHVILGDSELTMEAMDNTGEYWLIYGSLSQTSSEDPTAEPQGVYDTFLSDEYFFSVSQATNVSDVIACEASLDIDSYLGDAAEHSAFYEVLAEINAISLN